MKILLTGVETENKGAELMLYAILQEIEKSHPDAKVYIHYRSVKQGLNYVETRVDLKYWPLSYFIEKTRIQGILSRLHLPSKHVVDVYGLRDADYLIDGSGFAFSDVWDFDDFYVWKWRKLLNYQKKRGCKIVFLPQAFGPINKEKTKELISLLNSTACLVMPRENVSYNYLKGSGLIDMSKVKRYTDFTSLVKGKVPNGYDRLLNGICIIPNSRMVDSGAITMEEYRNVIKDIVEAGRSSGHVVYLLNHEGKGDEKLALSLKDMLNNEVEVVTGLNALEVKGIISTAYLVVSSRFHGVASSLNSGVPCLATSWSHKYQELFRDYGFTDCVLPLDNRKEMIKRVQEYLNNDRNKEIRSNIQSRLSDIKNEVREMWKTVWSL